MKIRDNKVKFVSIDELTNKKEDIEKALKVGQGSARVRTLTINEIIEHVKNMIDKINKLVPKSYQNGTTIEYTEGAERFANSYKYTPEGTQLELTKRASYYVITINRVNCNYSAKNEYKLELNKSKKRDAIKKHLLNLALNDLEYNNNVTLNVLS